MSVSALLRGLPRHMTFVKVAVTSTFRPLGQPVRHNSQHRVILLPEIPDVDGSTNVLLKAYNEGLPNYTKVTEEDCYYGLGKALLTFEAEVVAMETRCEEGETDFDTLFVPLEKARCELENAWNSVIVLHLASDALDRDRFLQLHKRTERAFLSRHGSRGIHNALMAIKADNEKTQKLDNYQMRILDRYLTEYHHQGYELNDEKFKTLTGNWMAKYHEARRDYRFRHGHITRQFRHSVNDPLVMEDFPVDVLTSMALDSSQPTRGPWSITLHPYIFNKFLEYCPDRKRRQIAYNDKVARGGKIADSYYDVNTQIKEIRLRRHAHATVLGYEHYADMSMETKMAANVDEAQQMIDNLLESAKTGQEKELDNLQDYAESRGFDNELAEYDVPFFKRKQRRTILGLSDDDLRDYFPLPKVVNGIFGLCSQMFDLHIEEVKKDSNVWHPEVKLFRVVDASGKELGHFYFDPYIRDDKGYPGGDKGWYVPIRNASQKAGSSPLGAMILSLPTPGYGKPALLSFDEVKELLRNFGNMLVHISAQMPWVDLSGKTGIEWDALDVSADFMTHWLYTPDVLSSLSGHWSSNEPLNATLIESLCQSRNHLAGYQLCNELYLAAVDLTMFSEPIEKSSVIDIAENLRPNYLLLPSMKDDRFPMLFDPIFSGDQGAAIFCKTWSEMLAADAFSAIKEAGQNKEEVKKVAMRFRNTFLNYGSSLPAAEVFRKFRGRDPAHEALLVSLGLKEIPTPKKRGQGQ